MCCKGIKFDTFLCEEFAFERVVTNAHVRSTMSVISEEMFLISTHVIVIECVQLQFYVLGHE